MMRASRVVVGFWWDPVCRLLHLRVRALLINITGEYRARVLLVLLPGCMRQPGARSI